MSGTTWNAPHPRPKSSPHRQRSDPEHPSSRNTRGVDQSVARPPAPSAADTPQTGSASRTAPTERCSIGRVLIVNPRAHRPMNRVQGRDRDAHRRRAHRLTDGQSSDRATHVNGPARRCSRDDVRPGQNDPVTTIVPPAGNKLRLSSSVVGSFQNTTGLVVAEHLQDPKLGLITVSAVGIAGSAGRLMSSPGKITAGNRDRRQLALTRSDTSRRRRAHQIRRTGQRRDRHRIRTHPLPTSHWHMSPASRHGSGTPEPKPPTRRPPER